MRSSKIVGLGRTAEIFTWKENRVLKLFREGWPPSAVKWEEKVARTVSEAELPVPAVYGIVEVKDRHGIIYERIDGPSMLVELLTKPEKLEHFATLFAKLHAEMHTLEIAGLPSQRRRLEEKIQSAGLLPEKSRNAALKALKHLPDGHVLCHGDFHPDNIIMSTRGPIVIDWNDATQGNPHADIARTLLLLSPPKELIVDYAAQKLGDEAELDAEQVLLSVNSFVDNYLTQYSQIHHTSSHDVELWRLSIAAARLSEGIEEEENRLLSIVGALSNTGSP